MAPYSIPSQGTKIPQAPQHGQKKKKKKIWRSWGSEMTEKQPVQRPRGEKKPENSRSCKMSVAGTEARMGRRESHRGTRGEDFDSEWNGDLEVCTQLQRVCVSPRFTPNNSLTTARCPTIQPSSDRWECRISHVVGSIPQHCPPLTSNPSCKSWLPPVLLTRCLQIRGSNDPLLGFE